MRQASKISCRTRCWGNWLEVKATTKLQHTWRPRRGGTEAGDVAKASAAYRRVSARAAQSENGVIEHVEGLEAYLECRLTIHMERTEDTGVNIGLTRAAEFVA